MAHVVSIFLRPSARTPVRAVQRVDAVVGQGLTGDHAGGGKRQVTLLDLEAWRAACTAIGQDVDPAHRRANLVVTGLDLASTVGRTLRIGATAIEVCGETRPCELLDDGAPGLCAALRPRMRGGVHGRIVAGGPIAIGDTIESDTVSEARL